MAIDEHSIGATYTDSICALCTEWPGGYRYCCLIPLLSSIPATAHKCHNGLTPTDESKMWSKCKENEIIFLTIRCLGIYDNGMAIHSIPHSITIFDLKHGNTLEFYTKQCTFFPPNWNPCWHSCRCCLCFCRCCRRLDPVANTGLCGAFLKFFNWCRHIVPFSVGFYLSWFCCAVATSEPLVRKFSSPLRLLSLPSFARVFVLYICDLFFYCFPLLLFVDWQLLSKYYL